MIAEAITIIVHPALRVKRRFINTAIDAINKYHQGTKLEAAGPRIGRIGLNLTASRNAGTQGKAFEDNIRFCINFSHDLPSFRLCKLPAAHRAGGRIR